MNKRTMAIIRKLDSLEREITIEELANHFKVSQRTIRNDLNGINDLLKNNGLSEVFLKSGGKVNRNQDFINLMPLVSESDYYSYKLSKEERKRVAASLLVTSTGYITLSQIADSLFVSRATIINDLDEIKLFINKENLTVLSHPNKGLRVEGMESDKREFLIKIYQSNHQEKEFVDGQISVQAGNKIIIQKIVNEQEHVHKSFLTDLSFQKIMIYLGIMVNRNMQGEFVEVQANMDERRYRMAQDILKYVSQYCHINSTEDEVRYLSTILSKARYIRQTSNQQNAIKIQTVTRRFIDCVSEEIGIPLNGDYDFFESLSNHLESVFTQNTPTYPENSIIDEVLEENPGILQAVNKCLPIISQHVSREIAPVEIGYIAVHICAALERKKNKEIAFHVVVACHAGIGTSQLLLEKLKKHFNFQIVDIISSHEARFLNAEKADFVISTVPLEGCKLDYVVVSPLLSDEDYIRVGNKIDTLRDSRHLPSRVNPEKVTAKGLIEKLGSIVYETVPDEAEELMKKIRRTVREYFNQSIEAEAEIFSPYLHHLLPENHIILDVECEDWRDSVRKSASILLKLGYIEERYIDAMIHNIEENGPYVVLSPGFAVPHEGMEMGSVKVGMSMIRLKHPVKFGVEEYDPVEFVCVLSAVDHKTHLKAFFNLVNMLQNVEFKKRLQDCRTSKEASKIIEKFEYEL